MRRREGDKERKKEEGRGKREERRKKKEDLKIRRACWWRAQKGRSRVEGREGSTPLIVGSWEKRHPGIQARKLEICDKIRSKIWIDKHAPLISVYLSQTNNVWILKIIYCIDSFEIILYSKAMKSKSRQWLQFSKGDTRTSLWWWKTSFLMKRSWQWARSTLRSSCMSSPTCEGG